MCLILFAYQAHPDFALVVAANRDEFHRRRTRALARWADAPVIGGRDAEAGGTWMAMSADEPRRVGMVTNVRRGTPGGTAARSRGVLPVDFIRGDETPEAAARALAAHGDDFQPVNFLAYADDEMWWATNSPESRTRRVEPGVHGLSNGALDNDWPKVVDGQRAFADVLDADVSGASVEAYLDLLTDAEPADDARLPDTGVGQQRERQLSPLFINMPGYGTRASTVLRIGHDGHGDLTERRYGWRGRRKGTTTIRF